MIMLARVSPGIVRDGYVSMGLLWNSMDGMR